MEDSTRTEKPCTICGEVKSLDDYHRKATAGDGKRSECKICCRRAAREDAQRRKTLPKAEPAPTKICNKCRTEKLSSEFYVRNVAFDGLSGMCKACARQERADYIRDHPDRVAAQGKAWRDRNPGYSARTAKAWREANPERFKAYREQWARENAERLREIKREWYMANRAWVLAWPKRNPERAAESQRRYREKNREARAEYTRRRRVDKLGGTVADVDLDALWTGDCGICGGDMDRELRWPDPFSNSIDHIIPLSRGGTHEAHNLQWAHLRCNVSKGARMPEDYAA